ncbi:hypothetical protein NE237_008053 [Protea cynaroides]|uniref:Uncharacterized protein n=1 Tax=Protea cynaroides TaxID=273540 RepID=A0A9Q0QX22_9MAGN|nr:hypothetical protein NE237_008053 [Protea cynaroides]
MYGLYTLMGTARKCMMKELAMIRYMDSKYCTMSSVIGHRRYIAVGVPGAGAGLHETGYGRGDGLPARRWVYLLKPMEGFKIRHWLRSGFAVSVEPEAGSGLDGGRVALVGATSTLVMTVVDGGGLNSTMGGSIGFSFGLSFEVRLQTPPPPMSGFVSARVKDPFSGGSGRNMQRDGDRLSNPSVP